MKGHYVGMSLTEAKMAYTGITKHVREVIFASHLEEILHTIQTSRAIRILRVCLLYTSDAADE